MCGIAGVLYRDGTPADAHVLQAMASQLRHRGPDGSGVRSFQGAGLAHTRLAIIDLTDAAAQPLGSDDGKVWVTFNGEIYNFRELRAELEGKGHRFRSSGDTEVIVRLYEEEGPAAIPRLDGMFALAIWDDRRRQLLVARDRTGKKPLYVYDDGQKVVFASEIKAILAHPAIDDEPWLAAIPLYLTYGYVPTPMSCYRFIRKLPPASVQIFRHGGGDTGPQAFWDYPVLSDARSGSYRVPRVDEAELRIRELFFAAVKKRLVSDVPLGAFLSGGIDSSLVVAAMSRLSPGRVKTFSIGFKNQPEFDETSYARMVAERYGTDHTEFKVEPQSWDLVEKLAWHYDEPYGDSSAIPTYIVSKLSRGSVTVALTGDGGDELFAGYDRFFAAQLAEALPRPVAGLLWRTSQLVPSGRNTRTVLARGKRFLERASEPLEDRFRNWSSFFHLPELQDLLSPELAQFARRDLIGESFDGELARTRDADLVNRLLYLNARTYLLDDLNVKMDRASMAASLEARAPFLDTDLMEYVFRLPGDYKLRGRTKKWILKRAFRDLLPEPIARRSKMGFGVPLGAWFRGELRDYLQDTLLSPSADIYPMLRREAVQRMFELHQSGQRDFGQQFWLLSMLDMWLRRRSAAKRTYPGRLAS